MSREVRRVPMDWQHPKFRDPQYAWQVYEPLMADYLESLKWWRENPQWHEEGEAPPDHRDYMPYWPEEMRTGWQMYETVTEGTPISPVFATAEELARWLTDNGASAFGNATATYEDWLATCKAGFAVSMVATSDGLMSGVEHMGKISEADGD